MAEVKQVRHRSENDEIIDRARDFWSKNGRVVMIAAGVVILLVGGFLAYKFLIKAPKEQKADESLWKTEEYFRLDSLKQTLAGDGQFAGAEKVASQYSGTRAGNLAHLYAGAAALKAGDNNKAVT